MSRRMHQRNQNVYRTTRVLATSPFGGASGVSGSSGPSGSSRASGPSGSSRASGASGSSGASGASGASTNSPIVVDGSTKRSREFVNELMTLSEIDKVDKMIRARREYVLKKISDDKRLRRMVTDVPNLIELMESCSICTDPLLQDIGKESFGVISYTCQCSVVRTIHLKCCMSSASVSPNCAYCRTPITFVVPTLVENSPNFKKIRVGRKPINAESTRTPPVPPLQSDSGSEPESEPESETESEPQSQVLLEESQGEETIDESFLGLDVPL